MAQTRVPCIGRRILHHCATREVPADFSSRLTLTQQLIEGNVVNIFITHGNNVLSNDKG